MKFNHISKRDGRQVWIVLTVDGQVRQHGFAGTTPTPGPDAHRHHGLRMKRPASIDSSVGRSSCFLEDRPEPEVRDRAGLRMASDSLSRSRVYALGTLAAAWLVLSAMAEPPTGSPSTTPDPTTATSPPPAPTPPTTVDDGAELPLPAAGSATPDPDAPPLFRTVPPAEPDPALEAAKRREADLLDAQNTLVATNALSRTTFQRGETNAEELFNGIGGVPRGLSPLFTAPGASDAQGIRIGPFSIHPVVSTGLNYVSTTGGRNLSTNGFYGTISPAFTLTLGEPATGRSLSMVYTGSLSFGSNSAGSEPYQQSFALAGSVNFTKLNLGVGLNYSQLSGADRDSGGQNVNRNLVGLSVNANYLYSEKTSVTTTLSAPLRLFGRGSSSEGVNSITFLNYAYSPLTTVGLGFGLGELEVEAGQTQVFEQALGKLSYSLTQKITFSGTFGCEFRDAGAKEQITPVFGLGLSWNLREGTVLTLHGERTIVNSAAQEGTNYTDTNLTASVSQRLGNSVQFTGAVGYENASYTGVVHGAASNRDDNEIIVQGALSTRVRDHWTLTGTVSYAKNFSTENAFRTVQTSLQFSYVY